MTANGKFMSNVVEWRPADTSAARIEVSSPGRSGAGAD